MAAKELIKLTAEAARKAAGFTAKELQELSAAQFSKLTNAQLKGALRTMQKATSQRKRRLEKAGVYSDALRGFNERGGIKTDLKGRVAMQAELKRAIQFMQSKTSTITGARESEAQARQDIGLPASAGTDTVADTWNMFHRLQEQYPGYLNKEMMNKRRYKNVQDAIGKAYNAGMSEEDIRDKVRGMYEAAERGNSREVSRIIRGMREYGESEAAGEIEF